MTDHRRVVRCAVGLLLAVALTGCGDDEASPAKSSGADEPLSSSPAPAPAPASTQAADPQPTDPTSSPAPPASSAPPSAEPKTARRVLAISIDGLNPDALTTLGRNGAPSIWTLFDNGAATLNARTEVELTVTLPNHVGMVTGRPVNRSEGGHGVSFNGDRPGKRVPPGPDGPIQSIFTDVHQTGGQTAVFAGKTKFDIFDNTWPQAVDQSVIEPSLSLLTSFAASDLSSTSRAFTFVHIAEPDEVGHHSGWLSPRYLQAVRDADEAVGRLVAAGRKDSRSRGGLVVILTADHGGEGRAHGVVDDRANFTIPFVIEGQGIPSGDLYQLSPQLVDPGTGRPGYTGAQPMRNCDVANVSAVLLGLDAVPGSRCVAGLTMPFLAPTG